MAKATAKRTEPQNPRKEYEGIQLLPTPRVGDTVHYWTDDRGEGEPITGIVTQIEGPGKVQLYIIGPSHMPYFKRGVNWKGNDDRMKPNRPFRRNGIWAFREDNDPFERHRTMLADKQDFVVESIRQKRAIQEKIKEEHEHARSVVSE